MIITFISIVFLSFIGMSVIVGRHVPEIIIMNDSELQDGLNKTTPIFLDVYRFGVEPAGRLWRNKIIPSFFAGIEKLIGKFKLGIDKLDNLLGRLDDYLRRRSVLQGNGEKKSEYWNNVNEFKNNLSNNTDNVGIADVAEQTTKDE